jgi:hypothetical protein
MSCVAVLPVYVAYHFAQTIVAGVRASKLVRYQQSLVEKATSGPKVLKPAQIEPELRSDEVLRFDKDQLDKFSHSITFGLLYVKSLRFYSDLLQQYRRSYALVILNVMSYTWLFAQSLILFTIVNYAISVAEPQQFKISGDVSFVSFVYYTTTALYGNTIPQIVANGGITTLVATVAAIYGPLCLLSLGTQIVISLRQSKEDAAFGDLIRLVRAREAELSRQLEAEYEATPEEAARRLQQLGHDMGPVMKYFVSKIPDRISRPGDSEESDE